MDKKEKPKKSFRRPKEKLREVGDTLSTQTAALVPQLRVELLQNRQAVVDGCKGVLEYSDSCIRLSSDRLILRFTGKGLLLRTFNSTSAIVEGQIATVEFM
ncbi:MAG: YabP/YqfC family sporulation protein [Angelakisella sp.]